ncbi:MAG: O-methyltransferase [Gemmataceae bacterium]
MRMEPYLEDLLSEIHAWGKSHDAQQPEHARRMLNLHPDTARLASVLALSNRAASLLEVGTSNGYSTIWLAWAARVHGGRLISIDHSAEKLEQADRNLCRALLRDYVDLRHGDAADQLRELPGPFDFVLFDSVRMVPRKQMELLLPKLTRNAVILADNALSHVAEMSSYVELVCAQPDLFHIIVPVGKGLSVAYRKAA